MEIHKKANAEKEETAARNLANFKAMQLDPYQRVNQLTQDGLLQRSRQRRSVFKSLVRNKEKHNQLQNALSIDQLRLRKGSETMMGMDIYGKKLSRLDLAI
mgnify:CR=1 FL=1